MFPSKKGFSNNHSIPTSRLDPDGRKAPHLEII